MVDGFIASVEVSQRFRNPTDERIEAVYLFPLPENAAVDQMVMQVGERQIVGEVHPRAQARAIYEQAKTHGQRAALLEQERPNLFTQSVATDDEQRREAHLARLSRAPDMAACRGVLAAEKLDSERLLVDREEAKKQVGLRVAKAAEHEDR